MTERPRELGDITRRFWGGGHFKAKF